MYLAVWKSFKRILWASNKTRRQTSQTWCRTLQTWTKRRQWRSNEAV